MRIKSVDVDDGTITLQFETPGGRIWALDACNVGFFLANALDSTYGKDRDKRDESGDLYSVRFSGADVCVKRLLESMLYLSDASYPKRVASFDLGESQDG